MWNPRNVFAALALVVLSACASSLSDVSGGQNGASDGATPGEAGSYASQVGTFACPEVYPEETIGDLNLSGHVQRDGSRYTTADANHTCHGGGRTRNPNYRAPGAVAPPQEQAAPRAPSGTPQPKAESNAGNGGETGDASQSKGDLAQNICLDLQDHPDDYADYPAAALKDMQAACAALHSDTSVPNG